MAKKQGLGFTMVKHPSQPAAIETHASSLRQCLLRLADYALGSSDEGEVMIQVLSAGNDSFEMLRFDIMATGQRLSVDPQAQPKEQELPRLDLGWAVVKGLARALGGDLTVAGGGPERMSVSLTIANQNSGGGSAASANRPDSLDMIRDLWQTADRLQTETRQAPE